MHFDGLLARLSTYSFGLSAINLVVCGRSSPLKKQNPLLLMEGVVGTHHCSQESEVSGSMQFVCLSALSKPEGEQSTHVTPDLAEFHPDEPLVVHIVVLFVPKLSVLMLGNVWNREPAASCSIDRACLVS